jgi:dihydrolipoamide dehydrogenase
MKMYDVIIIGGGPGGYVSAIRAGQLGLKTALIEKARLGGMCLNWGCVPSRRLMESARIYQRVLRAGAFGVDGVEGATFNWRNAIGEKDKIVTKLVKGVEFLMKKNKVELISGTASLAGEMQVKVGEETLTAKAIIIATGSRPSREPVSQLPESLVLEIDQLYASAAVADKIVIMGGDVVACETASLLALLRKKVTIVASQEKLVPWMDQSLAKFVSDRFKKDGIRVITGAHVPTPAKGGIQVGSDVIECDVVVNASRRIAIIPERHDVPLDLENGAIRTNEFMQTNIPGVYAVGDVTGQLFAHVASAQGMCAVNHIAGMKEPVDYARMPVTIFMEPEIASVGLTEQQLTESGTEFIKGEFPMSVNSRALVEGSVEGFVKILAEPKYGEVLGVHIVAERATDLIAEAVMCLRTEGTLDDLAHVVHAHPTVSETVLEAGYKAMGRPVHV